MKYTGGCHCEKVRFEVEMEIDKAGLCNCSICSKRGFLLGFVTDEKFKLLTGKEVLTDYQFGKKRIHHYFCSVCGVAAFGQGEAPTGMKMRAINLRCLDGVDVETIPITKYDGKSL